MIFLDEFNKANSIIYAALYQMFDTGEYEDNNFHVDLKNTVIICASNYENQQKIFEHLGEVMFFRINSLIKYEPLKEKVKIKLINKYYSNLLSQLLLKEQELIESLKIKKFIFLKLATFYLQIILF